MAEELRFFLRTAVYSIVIGAIYWFASYAETGAYEWAGTVLLVFVVFSTGSFVFVAGIHVPDAWRRAWPGYHETTAGAGTAAAGASQPAGPGMVAGLLNRVFGMAEDPDLTRRQPLEGGPDALPTASLWPFVAGAAALLIGLGLVYGPWLLIPGIAVAIIAIVGWIVQGTRSG
jgi:hypothetical protein